MSPRRDNNQRHTEVPRQTTTTTAISHYLSSNLLESTQMHENTTSGSGCSQSRSVNSLGHRHPSRRQPEQPESSGRWHLLPSGSTFNVMPIRVSSTLHNLDTQRTDCRSPNGTSARPLNRYCKLNASPIVATLWVLSSCCLLLMLATNTGLCAPTTKIVSHQPVAVSVHSGNNNKGPSHSSPGVVHHHAASAAAANKQIIVTSEQAAGGLVDVQPIIIVTHPAAHHESSKQRESSGGSVTPAHHSRVDKFVAADDESSIEDETILLVLAGESSPSSIRRLIKRSGISDQRLAEIQMIRALKKQMERAATKIAAEAGGNGAASDNAGGDVK